MSKAEHPDALLTQDMGRFYSDPLGFVMYAFPWDSDASIQIVELESPYRERFGCQFGPDAWACEFLDSVGADVRERRFDGVHAVEPIQYAVSSGHGIGKSAMAAWLTLWIMSTRPHSKGVVTANTGEQLASKTWAGVSAWLKRCITRHWFTITTGKGAMRLVHNANPDSWRVDAQTSREENSESFAGLHAASSTPWYLFDEASAIPAKIWEVAEGGKTDGEPMHFAFGNPTRNTGAFAECFGRQRHRWNTRQIDSRKVKITNKQLIGKWVADYGEDSDFVRVRVRGIFPRASSMQFVPRDSVDEAMSRPMAAYRPHSRVALVGVDVARFGDDESVIYTRMQRDGRTHPLLTFRELSTMQLAAQVGEHINELKSLGLRVIVFVDGGGIGGGVVDRLRQLEHEVIEVNFGGKPDDPRKYKDKAAEMWDRARGWLATGYLPEDEEVLAAQLTSREYGYNDASQIVLERKEDMKRRGLESPDRADAFCLTFAFPAMEVLAAEEDDRGRHSRAHGSNRRPYDPFAPNRLRSPCALRPTFRLHRRRPHHPRRPRRPTPLRCASATPRTAVASPCRVDRPCSPGHRASRTPSSRSARTLSSAAARSDRGHPCQQGPQAPEGALG